VSVFHWDSIYSCLLVIFVLHGFTVLNSCSSVYTSQGLCLLKGLSVLIKH